MATSDLSFFLKNTRSMTKNKSVLTAEDQSADPGRRRTKDVNKEIAR